MRPRDDELAIVRAARGLIPAFAGERPMPCHRDYCPANWLVSDDGAWVGVIDFEFSRWDVRVADFTRYSDWEWMRRPDLVQALLCDLVHMFRYTETARKVLQQTL